jgi:large subunit ribosomal protein L25
MNITVTKREGQTKGLRKQRLRQGFVPGAIYGKGIDPLLIEVPAKSVAGILLAQTGLNTIVDLTIDGESQSHTVMVDNLERDPITRGFRNIGFHQVKKGDKVTAQVPIHLTGTPAAVASNDAMLEQTLETITVHALPTDLPPHLDIDVSNMGIGDVMRVADLPQNPKLEYAQAEDAAIASVRISMTAQAVEETTPEAETAATQVGLSGADALTEQRADSERNSDSVTGTASP